MAQLLCPVKASIDRVAKEVRTLGTKAGLFDEAMFYDDDVVVLTSLILLRDRLKELNAAGLPANVTFNIAARR